MEIKILCDCGTKFKFDVEPVNHRMPAPVNCPACGADATAQANAFIQSAESPAPAPAGPPVAPSPPAQFGVRISRPAAQPQGSFGEAPGAPPPPPPPPPFRPMPVRQPVESESPAKKVLIALLAFVVIGFGAWRVGHKWFNRIALVSELASAAGDASVDRGESEGAKNLWYDDCAVLFIRHTNHLEVAEACKGFWKTSLHKNLTSINSAQESMNPGEYELISAHNGYVRIVGAHDWPEPQHEALAAQLSQQFGTLVFEWRSEHIADTYHFGVYDQGARKFHAKMDIKITEGDAKEIVTTENNDFAIANGFKPGPEGFKEFNVLDADKITQKLGMKIWDEKDETNLTGMLLKETGTASD